MVRPYGMKGQKRKKREANYDKEEEPEEIEHQSAKRKSLELTTQIHEDDNEEEGSDEEESEKEEGGEGEGEGRGGQVDVLEGIPACPIDQKGKKPKVIFVIERASLEVGKVGKTYQLLNSDEHSNFLRKNNKNPADYRPDIVHQALLSVLDSPLNKAGMLQNIYVKTEKGVLFEVKPHVRIPRTFKRFAGIMLQLLQKLSISAAGKREKLLRVIKNPVTQYLPANSRKIGFSFSSQKLVDVQKYVADIDNDMDLVFVVGAMSHGKVETEYTDDLIAISGYPLSAAFCISMICQGVAKKWNIL